MIIYKATSPNGKVYIGLTKYSLEKRIYRHKIGQFHKKNKNIKFYRALRKYKFECFKWEVIDTASTYEELQQKEKYYISLYGSLRYGYNSTLGGEGVVGNILTNQQKNKASILNKKYWTNLSSEEKLKKLEHLNSYRGHNKKTVIDNSGNIFISLGEAAKYHKMSESGILYSIKNKRLCRDKKSFEYYNNNPNFKGHSLRKIVKPNYRIPIGKNDIFKKKIIDSNGIIYESISSAAILLKISRKTIQRLLKTGKQNNQRIRFNYV